MVDYYEVTTRLLTENMNVAPGEMLLVVADTSANHIGRVLFETGVDLGLDSGLFEIPPMERNGTEPPESIARAMGSVDAVVCPTSVSLTHTRAREAMTETGVRVVTMPGITDQMFSADAITADYEEVERLTMALTEKFTAADEARIEVGGASATMSLSGRDDVPSDGVVTDPGDSGNLPSGGSYVVPVEGTATGTLVFDGGSADVGVLGDPLTVELDTGHITPVGDAAVDEFLDATSGDDCVRRVCELGLGTNLVASIVGTVLEDEKVYGTCHVALGDNPSLGGTIDYDSHLSDVILEPTASLDDDAVVAGGEMRV